MDKMKSDAAAIAIWMIKPNLASVFSVGAT
jgi:hypothetical protein